MVRLVFRPYTQIRRTICTSVSLRPSICLSADFNLFRHSSPSFGSRQERSTQTLHRRSRSVGGARPSLSLRTRACHPGTRTRVPWSVFLDGSEVPIPPAGTPSAALRRAHRSPTQRHVPRTTARLDHRPQCTARYRTSALRSESTTHAAEVGRQCQAHPGFLLPISSTF